MNAAKNMYEVLLKMHPDKVAVCTRKGSFSTLLSILGLPCDPVLAEEIFQYSRRQEAAKLKAPYLLSDYLCYVYAGTMSQFAREQDTTVERLEIGMYDGCYWHGGELLQPVPLGKPREVHGVDITEFMLNCICFEGGKAHTIELYNTYVLYTKGKGADRVRFCNALGAELAARGIHWSKSIRIGGKVTSGYKGISVKNI